MSSFDVADFLAPLDGWVLGMSFVLGLTMGALMWRAGRRPIVMHLYWMLAGGAVFFVPLSLLRLAQGSPVWERLAATFLLWIVYIIGISIGSRRAPHAND